MPIPDPKRAALQDQVNAKVKWNASEDEVVSWLWERHSIRGTDAAEMFAEAQRHRAAVVRERSLYGMILAGIATLICAGMIAAQLSGGFIFIRRSLVMLFACAFCGAWFLRYLFRFLSGHSTIAE
jgi:hypothetical protein